MTRSRRLGLGLVALAVVAGTAFAVVVARGPSGGTAITTSTSRSSTSQAPSSSDAPATSGTPSAPSAALAVDPTGRARRVADILDSMHTHAFNPDAPPNKNSSLTGGTFINWHGTWDGNLSTASENTNLQTSGQTDDATGANPRHDPVTDLLYLRNLAGYVAQHPADHSFDADIDRIQPIVTSEFAPYTYYRCWIYSELRDLDTFQPQRGWDGIARNFISAIYSGFYDHAAGTIIDKSHSSYRTDFAAECAAGLLDAGKRYGIPSWSDAGRSTVNHILASARDATTHLFPLQMATGSGTDTVKQAQIKVGSEAQLLDALLSARDITGDAAVLQAVKDAVNEMYSPQLGLWDQTNGGFNFSVNSDGTALQSSYKETRQGWMVAVLEHLDRIEKGAWTQKVTDMIGVVENKLWQAPLKGYVYRVTPAFAVYQTHEGPNRALVTEDFVTTEAMGIAGQVLEGASS